MPGTRTMVAHLLDFASSPDSREGFDRGEQGNAPAAAKAQLATIHRPTFCSTFQMPGIAAQPQ